MNRLGFVLTLGSLSTLSAFALDICLPVQPDIARALGQPATSGAMLISSYFWGFAAAHLVWGPLSDRLGRTWPLAVAMAGFTAMSVLCALATSFEVLLWSRFAQGVFGGAGGIISRAIARDQGGGGASAKLLSTMAVMLGAAPLVAPPLGSLLILAFDWPSTFWLLVALGGLMLAGQALFLRRVDSGFVAQSGGAYLAGLGPVLRHRDFLLGTFLSAISGVGFPALLAVGSEIAQERYGVTPAQFGPLFAVIAVAFIAGSVTARRTIGKWSRDRIVLGALAIGAAGGAALTLYSGTGLSLEVFWGLIAVYAFSYGALFPATMAQALEPAGAAAGSAASLLGLATIVAGALGAELASSALFANTFQALCLLIALPVFLCLAVQAISMVARR